MRRISPSYQEDDSHYDWDLGNKNKDMKYKIGDEVYWTDPDEDLSSGYYKVVDILCTEEKTYSISNGLSEAEVYETELS